MRCVHLLALACLLLASRVRAGDTVTPRVTIPDFGAQPTITSIADGAWSAAATWSPHRVPGDGDVVLVAAGTTVTVDGAEPGTLAVVSVRGSLRFRADVDTALSVGTVLVPPSGTIAIGSDAQPIAADRTARVIFADRALDTGSDPEQYGTGLLVLGSFSVRGAAKTPFIRLASEPHAGDTHLALSQPAVGWRVGDRVFVPDTRQLDWNEHGDAFRPQAEERLVAAIAGDGLSVNLSSALAYDHLGARDSTDALRYLPHAVNLTRNVELRSANPGGTRAHALFTGRAAVDVRGAAFVDMGRTTNDPLDSTTFDAGGNPTHIGANQIGRYPVHCHHLTGPEGGIGSGAQFAFVDDVVDSGGDAYAAHPGAKWGITVHDSHYGLVQGNVVHSVAGAGIVAEDGSETGNVIERNLVARVTGTGQRDNGGRDGVAFWFRGPSNRVRDNVATDVWGDVYTYGYSVNALYLGKAMVPAAPGDDAMERGVEVDMNATPLLEFARNEAYAVRNGLTTWWLGTFGQTELGSAGTVDGLTVWHHYGWAYFGYNSAGLTLADLVVIGDTSGRLTGYWPSGLYFADYWQSRLAIVDPEIDGMGNAIQMSCNSKGESVIRGGVVRHCGTGVIVSTPMTVNGSAGLDPHALVVRGTRFPDTTTAIAASYDDNASNLVILDQLFVYDFEGNPADDFQVFYRQQAADFVMPQSGGDNPDRPRIASPEDGLTNAQNWAKYGIAIAGAVAPASAAERAGIDGLVVAISDDGSGATSGGGTSGTTGGTTTGATGGGHADADGGGHRCGIGGLAALLALTSLLRRRRR